MEEKYYDTLEAFLSFSVRNFPIELIKYGFACLDGNSGDRHLHRFAIGDGSQINDYFHMIRLDSKGCEICDFYSLFSGCSLFFSSIYIFGIRPDDTRSYDPKDWKPLSLKRENEKAPFRDDCDILVGSATGYSKKFDIYIDRNDLAFIKLEEIEWSLPRMSIKGVFKVISTPFMDAIATDNSLEKDALLGIENEILSRYFAN